MTAESAPVQPRARKTIREAERRRSTRAMASIAHGNTTPGRTTPDRRETTSDHIGSSALRAAAGAAVPCVAALLLAVGVSGCKVEEPVFDPHAIQRPERQAASTYQNYQMPPLPTTLQSTFLPQRNGNNAANGGRPTTQP